MSNTLSNQDSTISNLESKISAQNSTIDSLQSTLNNLNAKIQSLESQISSLQSNLTASNSQIQALQQQVSGLNNKSSQLQLELSLVEQTGNLAFSVLYLNQTITVAGNSNYSLGTDANGYNGTLYFMFPYHPYCQNSGDAGYFVQGQTKLYFLLNSKGLGGAGSFTQPLNSSAFALYMENIGSSSVTCFFSLIYVYHL